MDTTPYKFRLACRAGEYQTHTSNVCPGFAQANLIVLPVSVADDFELLCQRNPVPCPLLARTEVGDPTTLLANNVIREPDLNLATDIPLYNIYYHGKLVDEVTNVSRCWSLQHVGFLIGCSFSFEKALINSQLTPRNIVDGHVVSMYKTSRQLDPAGVFDNNCVYVVSMRPYKACDLPRIKEVTRSFGKFHGEPIAWGFEDAVGKLGIEDLSKPDYGEPTVIAEGEIPVFWGCGVTPQLAVQTAADNIQGLTMGHKPGHMLVLDLKDEETTKL